MLRPFKDQPSVVIGLAPVERMSIWQQTGCEEGRNSRREQHQQAASVEGCLGLPWNSGRGGQRKEDFGGQRWAPP